MEAGKESSKAYEVGDLVSDGEFTGLVAAVVTDPQSSKSAYIMQLVDGTLIGVSSGEQITGGLRRAEAPGKDAAEVKPVAQSPAASATTMHLLERVLGENQHRSADEVGKILGIDDGILEVAEYVSKAVLRRCNDRTGKPIIAAAAVYKACMGREWKTDRDIGRALVLAADLMQAWQAVPDDERRRICGGWNAPAKYPTPTMLLAEWGVYTESVGSYLAGWCGADGEVGFMQEFGLTHGRTDVARVQIREGTDKATAIAALKSVLTALEDKWEEAINLAEGAFLTYPKAEGTFHPFRAGSAGKKPHTATPDSPKLGGKESQKAKAVAA